MTVVASCSSPMLGLAMALAVMVLVPAASRAATASAPGSALAPIDATELGMLSDAALEEIATQATVEAATHGIEPGQLRISLVVIDHLEVIRGVRVSIITDEITLADPDGDPRGPLVAQCQACGEDELKTISIEGVLEALTRFERLRAEAETAARAEAEAAEAAESPVPEPMTAAADEPRRPLQPLGWAGVAALGLGASALVVGATFVGLGERSPGRMTSSQDYVRNYPAPGYVLLGLGGTAAIGGAVMLAVERRRARASGLSLAPLLSPVAVGLDLRTRF